MTTSGALEFEGTFNEQACDFEMDQWQAGGMNSFSQTCFSEYWSALPDLIDGNAYEAKKTIIVDPWDFNHRMSLVKYCIEHMGDETVWGNGCSKHFLWAYIAQLDWQRRSGRLENPSKWDAENTVGNGPFDFRKVNGISKKSWWGHMNLNFSVAVYLGAAKAGLVPDTVLSDKSLEDNIAFQECIQIWRGFFANAFVQYTTFCHTINDEGNNNHGEISKLNLYRALWTAHSGVIRATLPRSEGFLAVLPKEDRDVGLGWCKMVELLDAADWQLLSLDSLLKFGCGYLPTRRLEGPKTMQWLKDNRPLEYTTVGSLHQLKDISEDSLRRACRFFSRVSRWRFARNNMPRTLHVLTHGNPVQKVLALFRVVVLALLPCPRSCR
jgi:hypothetical protein